MALHWDVTACHTDDFDPTSEEEWPTTHAIIWYMITLGFSAITQDNWAKVYARLLYWQRLFDSEGVKVTKEVIWNRIGLKTNASEETDAQWRKRMWTCFMQEHVPECINWQTEKLREMEEV